MVTGQTRPTGVGEGPSAWSPPAVGPWQARTRVRIPNVPESRPWQTSPAIGTADAAIRSALIPGAGQLALGQKRSWAYLGLEAIGWFLYLDRRGAGADLRTEYRDYAWDVGRIQAGTRVDGDFDYYETMSNWDRSGAYDRDTGRPGIQPEDDTSLYNGLIWARARGIFSVDPAAGPGDPQYEAAITYYETRAYGPDLLWDWTSSPGGRSTYVGLIEASDQRFRQARNAMGLIIANHLVSAVDAFLSARAPGLSTRSRVLPGPTGQGVTVATSIRRGTR